MNELNIHPELEPETLKRYSLKSRAAIQKLLRTLYENENELYVYLAGQDSFFISEILAIDYNEKGSSYFWIASPSDKSLLAHLGPDQEAVLVAFPDGVKIQLLVRGVELARFERLQSIRLQQPHRASRLQKRTYFRVFIDPEMQTHLVLHGRAAHQTIQLLDLSLGGCSLHFDQLDLPLKVGKTLGVADLYLTNQSSPISVSLKIKNTMNGEENQGHQVGCQMDLIRKEDLKRLQRFLLQTERRQRVLQATHD